MLDLQSLYQEVILDHNKHPRNFYSMSDCDCQQRGYNPLCGDELTLYLQLDNNKITKASFEGKGCAISIASASILTEEVVGKTIEQARQLFQDFHAAVTADKPSKLGKLEILTGVKKFPARVKCATLAWHTLETALDE